jgi:peptide-methionine (S)-S-oxide reductase
MRAWIALMVSAVPFVVCSAGQKGGVAMATNAFPVTGNSTTRLEIATFAGGCFWCTEAVFQRVKGVASVKSGYTGGTKPNPTYEEVCTGKTGHAEAIQVAFDPTVATFESLLDLFWRAHDPTTLNRQGADVGTQYRSAIFYHSEEQRRAAEASRKALDESKRLGAPVVTAIEPAGVFYPAEAYHQDYYKRNANAPYCRAVIAPKLKKLEAGH